MNDGGHEASSERPWMSWALSAGMIIAFWEALKAASAVVFLWAQDREASSYLSTVLLGTFIGIVSLFALRMEKRASEKPVHDAK